MFKPIALAAALVAISSAALVQGCAVGEAEISVEGAVGAFCVQEPICKDQVSTGACPQAQSGLPNGAYCGLVYTGVYGCKQVTADMIPAHPAAAGGSVAATTSSTPDSAAAAAASATATKDCPSGSLPVSVEGVRGVFCAQQKVCVGTTTNSGYCPVAQPGLEGGSYCGIVASGVYGCKPGKPETALRVSTPGTPLPVPVGQCPAGASPITVEGVLGVYCVAEPVCVGSTSSTGNCPGVHQELPSGSYCGVVASGVYGCKQGSAPVGAATAIETTTTVTTTGTTGTTGTTATTTGTTPAAPSSNAAPATSNTPVPINPALSGQCPSGSSPVSVVGISRVFCAVEPICMGTQTNTGSCPVPQYELPNGSSCVWLQSGAFGCRAN